jgi:CBS domain-containing protein
LESKVRLETCQSCGARLVENASYCHACGAAVGKNTTTQEFTVSADEVAKKVRELIQEGNVSRIVVKDEGGKTLLEIPVTAGVVGVLLAPWLAAAGAIAALATRCTIVVVRKRAATSPTGAGVSGSQ